MRRKSDEKSLPAPVHRSFARRVSNSESITANAHKQRDGRSGIKEGSMKGDNEIVCIQDLPSKYHYKSMCAGDERRWDTEVKEGRG